MPKITLCLIARDEEALLPGCLQSVRDLVDDMVVVDTGSRDETVRVAEEAGARVIHHRWNDDFAAARNAAVEQVEDGFVLLLDADERLAPGSADVLRAEVEKDEIDCGLLPLYNADRIDATAEEVLDGSARLSGPVLLGRLMRRTPDLRWEGIVHEHVTQWALKNNRRKELDAPIVHYGAVPSVREEKRKDERNLRLLERRCKQDAGNPAALGYLCQELIKAGKTERALRTAEKAWRVVEKLHKRSGPSPDAVLPATLLAHLWLHEGRLDPARAVLRKARKLSGGHPNLSYLLGCVAEQTWLDQGGEDPAAKLLESAEKNFRDALAFGDTAFATDLISGATTWAASTRLGTVLLFRLRPADALEAFDSALALRSQHVEARLGRVESLLELGQDKLALEEVEALLHPKLADGWVLACVAGLRFGGFEAVAPLYGQAARIAREEGWVAPHRRHMLSALEDHTANAQVPAP